MRELKFKAWNGEIFSEPFSPWALLVDPTGGLMTAEGCSVWWDADGFRGENWRQYTDFKDKEGNRACEGDILKDDEGAIFTLQWDDFVYAWVTPQPSGRLSTLAQHNPDKIEIIGNVTEHPELYEYPQETRQV